MTNAEFYKPFTNPVIHKSNSSDGKYVIRLSPVTFQYFWKKAEAVKWLETYNQREETP